MTESKKTPDDYVQLGKKAERLGLIDDMNSDELKDTWNNLK